MVQSEENQLLEAYKIQDSIEDVLAILDSGPIQPDLMPERNLVQITNRIPIAHLAIERGMKGLIKRAGGGQDETHSLGKLYDTLRILDHDSAEFLTVAFDDSVNFYGYNPNRAGFEHFKSLKEYLSRVGGKKAFDALRYWAIGDPGTGETAIKFIAPPIHREILCALRSLLSSRPETISQRVDSQIVYAMWNRRSIHWTNEDEEKRTAIELYREWLMRNSDSPRDALRSKLHTGKPDFSHEYINEIFNEGWCDFLQSKDPAIQYFCYKQTYLQPGSQLEISDAIPEVDWIREDVYAKIESGSGTCLGLIDKQADGAWRIIPMGSSAKPIAPAACKLKDAKNHLVDRLTFNATVRVGSENKQLRLFGNQNDFPEEIFSQLTPNPEDVYSQDQTFKLEFWDGDHELMAGSDLTVFPASDLGRGYVTVLQGKVTSVSEQSVTVKGMVTAALTEEVQH